MKPTILQCLQQFLTFFKIGHDKRFCCFYWKTAANTAKYAAVKTAKTFIMTNF